MPAMTAAYDPELCARLEHDAFQHERNAVLCERPFDDFAALIQQFQAMSTEILALNIANRSLVPDAMITATEIACLTVERDAAKAEADRLRATADQLEAAQAEIARLRDIEIGLASHRDQLVDRIAALEALATTVPADLEIVAGLAEDPVLGRSEQAAIAAAVSELSTARARIAELERCPIRTANGRRENSRMHTIAPDDGSTGPSSTSTWRARWEPVVARSIRSNMRPTRQSAHWNVPRST